MVCAYSLHRNGKYWHRPDAFLPDRFKERSAYDTRCYVPFGGGPHICPASGLSTPILQLMLAYMIRRFRFSVQGTRCKPRGLVGLRLHPGLWLKLESR